MRKVVYILILLLLTQNSFGVQNNFDSLWSVWNSPSESDSSRLNAIYIITWNQYLFSQPDSAFYWAQEHYNFAKSKGIKKQMAIALGTQGVSFYIRSNYSEATKHYHKSLALYEELNDKKGEASMLNNIGLIYKEQDDFETALKYYQKSLKIKQATNDKWGLSSSYTNIGNILRLQGKNNEALEYHERSLDLKNEIGDKKGEAISLNNIGGILKTQKKNSEAIEYYEKALSIFSELNDKKGIAGTYNNMANVYLSANNHKKAIIYGEKGLELANQLGIVPEIREAALVLYESNKAIKNYSKALNMHELFIESRDSMLSEESRQDVIRLEYKYQYENQKAIDDAEHEKQLAIEQEAKEKQQIITYSTIAGLGLVGVFLLIVFNRLKVTRKQKNIIEQQKNTVELAHHELEEKNKEILDSITYAKRIQSAILPPDKLVKEYLQESFILYKPKDIVAGDFYWMESVQSDELRVASSKDSTPNTQYSPLVLFAAADCTGHGVPGAMVSVICNNGLNRSVREHGLTDPGEILDKTREIVIQEFEKSDEEVKDGMDIALCSLQQLADGCMLKYAGAHNPLWIIRNGSEEVEEIKANKQPIGKFDKLEPYTTHTIQLQEGDTIYIFSDGYADQFGGEKGKKYKAANFKKLLLSIQEEPIDQQKEIINQTFEKWKGDLEQLDDVCVIGVRI